MKHRRVGFLLLLLCMISIIGSIHSIIWRGFTERIQLSLLIVGICTVFLIVSILWEKGYYIQIMIYASAFVMSIFFDGTDSPYSLIFLFCAILMVYVYEIRINYYVIGIISAILYIIAMFVINIENAIGMLLFSIIIILCMHILLKPARGCDDK